MTNSETLICLWTIALLVFEFFAVAAMLQECRSQGILVKVQFSILEIWALLCGLAPTFLIAAEFIRVCFGQSSWDPLAAGAVSIMVGSAQLSGAAVGRLDWLLHTVGLEQNEWTKAGRILFWSVCGLAFVLLSLFFIPLIMVSGFAKDQIPGLDRNGHSRKSRLT